MAWLRQIEWPFNSAIFDGEACAGDGHEGIQAVFTERNRHGRNMALVPGEAVGHTLDLIVPEPYRTAHWDGFSRAVRRGHFAKDEVLLTSRALTKDGRVIVVELSAAIIRSHDDQVTGIMAIGRDITARRVREQADHERIVCLERQVAALSAAICESRRG